MKIPYQVLPKVTINNLNAPPKYFATAKVRDNITFDMFCEALSARCTATRADIKLVLTAMVDEMPRLLLNGYSLQLDELGIFKLSISSEGVDNPEDFTYHKIKGVNLVYTPGMALKKSLNRQARFERIKKTNKKKK